MKIDLHRHFGGCVSPATILKLLQKQGDSSNIATITDELQGNSKPYTFQNFLNRFQLLDKIKWTEEAIQITSKQIVWNIASENIDYFEIKLSIDRYVRDLNKAPEEIIKIFHKTLLEETSKWGIRFGIILGLKYETDKQTQLRWAKVIEDPDSANCLVGIDLIGDETYFNVDFYKPIFKIWKDADKGLEAHVGESQSAENVVKAIKELHVNRIAHGIKAAEQPEIMKLARDNNICFDIALTSNLHTGIIPAIDKHPVIKLIEYDVPITIGTDDPIMLNTTLDNEYQLLRSIFNINDEKLMDIMYNSIKYAFTKFT